MIDWTKPIEYTDGSEARVLRARLGADGDYVVTQRGHPEQNHGNYYYSDGSPVRGDCNRLHIRNRAEPANDELAELRAFKEAAIARFPELVPVDPDESEASGMTYSHVPWYGLEGKDIIDNAQSLCLKAIKRGRELERYAQGLTTSKN